MEIILGLIGLGIVIAVAAWMWKDKNADKAVEAFDDAADKAKAVVKDAAAKVKAKAKK